MNLIKVTKKSMMGLTDSKKVTPSLILYFITNDTEDFKIYQQAYDIASKDKHYHVHGFEVEFEIETDIEIIKQFFDKEIDIYQKIVDQHTFKINDMKETYKKIISKNENIKSKKEK